MLNKKILIVQLSLLLFLLLGCTSPDTSEKAVNQTDNNIPSGVWISDQGDGTYTNPVLHADYSDPDVVRVGDNYYMTASSFNCAPGLPILHSKDLVNWSLVNYAIKKQKPIEVFNTPQHGNGVWAPSIRFHKGEYYIYYGDPDFGIYMLKTKDPLGDWSDPVLVKEGKGWIDPCPLWDEDGKAYLVHAFAGSRAGIKSILLVHEMSADGTQLLDDGVIVFDGHIGNKTVEGPKFYKENGYYYIFAPAGGVTEGWQLVMRSKDPLGPYEAKKVIHQGNTEINGPHQGAWVNTQTGESWFLHFQDKEAFGRIVHMQPMEWTDGWPIIGVDINNDGIGEPVITFKKPDVGGTYPIAAPEASDEFNEPKLSLQWQWHANPITNYGYPSGRLGYLRLNAVPKPEKSISLWEAPNLLLQKFPANSFEVTTKVKFFPTLVTDRVGLIVMGYSYAYVGLTNTSDGLFLQYVVCEGASKGEKEVVKKAIPVEQSEVYFRVKVDTNSLCKFSYSLDGQTYSEIGAKFEAITGKWIGSKVGLFCISDNKTNNGGYANIDWFRFQ